MADGNIDTRDVKGPSTVKPKNCRFFQTKKGCHFGDDCRFVHIRKLSNESGSFLREANELRSGNEDGKQYEPKNLKPQNEDHEPMIKEKKPGEQKDSSLDRKGIVCKFFRRKRGCLKGDKCPFVHVIVDGESFDKHSEKNPGKTNKGTRRQTPHHRKELAEPVTGIEQETNLAIDSPDPQFVENCQQQLTGQGDPPTQDNNVTNSMVIRQGSGITLSNEANLTKVVETGERRPYRKKGNGSKGTDGGKGSIPAIAKAEGKSMINHAEARKQTSVPEKNNASNGEEIVIGSPFCKQDGVTKGTACGQGDRLDEKNSGTKGTKRGLGIPRPSQKYATEGTEPGEGIQNPQKDTLSKGTENSKGAYIANKDNVSRHGQKVEKPYKENGCDIRGTYTLADVIFIEPKRLRSTEIQQLKRRFGGRGGYSEIKENSFYKIKFKPTDPDWPFQIEVVYLTVSFPDDYPLHIFNVSLSEEQDLPQDIIRFVTQRIQQWTLQQEQTGHSQGNLKLFFRPFLRWFDKNLKSFFIDAGKEMGEMFVSNITGVDNTACEIPPYKIKLDTCDAISGSPPNSQHILQDVDYGRSCDDMKTDSGLTVFQVNRASVDGLTDDMAKEGSKGLERLNKDIGPENAEHFPSNETDSTGCIANLLRTVNTDVGFEVGGKLSMNIDSSNSNCEQSCTNQQAAQSSQSDTSGNDVGSLKTAERGTQIQFKGLNLEESTSTLRGDKIVFTLECSRCKQRIDQQLSASSSVIKQCSRCASSFAVMYRPAVIHQFSSVLGYLDVDGCAPFDVVLPESELLLGCFHCSKETTVKGLQYGGNWSWCTHCHQKLRFQIQSTRFQQLQSDVSNTAVSLRKSTVLSASSKPKKPSQSSGEKEGQPLPANGTCKHYKKSYRWLRFPCCGKCYPCDLCHEEEEGHEMKYATRMVCGFCSREQPYSQQPCSGCKAAVTKSHSAHWEGGKGCRDKLAMSRNDNQKYRQQGKTTSRKSQKHSEGKGKGHKGSK